MTTNSGVRGAADRASDSAVVRWGARLGYAASGVLHLLIAWLALQVAFGEAGGRSADQSGALGTIARQPWGEVLLWVACAGFALLALWQLTEVVTRRQAFDRVKAAGKAVLYAALGWTTATYAGGGRSSSSKQTSDFTATLLDQPGGQLLVGAVGVGILGAGGYHVYKGWKQTFLEDLREHPGRFAVLAGRVGYPAKGVALGMVGVLFLVAAVRHRSGRAGGLDAGLRALAEAPYGQALLTAVAVGIAAFGLYCGVRARYARL